ncbi:MAG TPA: peptide chain release factor 1 [Candidatus Atopostipes pullistercoris]|uniref:Peptide chain release factor 1 n=1 Tax=Candidatus Atopostipes pullistercoris TaxID=2838467 RepID=A0A9D2JYF4_9LACT|nr:peptide chain release factor 1 [Candidatus Atopostipes pullistercoris]
MFDQLENLEVRYDEINAMLSDPEITKDSNKLTELSKEEGELRETVQVFREYKQVIADLEGTEEVLADSSDEELTELAELEKEELLEKKEKIEEELRILLIPKDENDGKNIIMEIRGAAGGDEAQLFAGDLFHMYQKYADKQGWQTEVLESHSTGIGGYKEIILSISGKEVYGKLKYESGAHRVQRVPETESQGRVHTSTSTVLVMPEVEDVEIDINQNDIRVDIYRASGAGGQHVNMTDSAVRLTHEPTGIVVAMQDERSQLKNREKAMKVLRSRVFEFYEQQAQAEVDAERKSTIGTGDRSERIRTYNFPQGRVTDHRINLTVHKLEQVLNGELDEIIEALRLQDQAQKLEQL